MCQLPASGYHQAVEDFKKRLIRATLTAHQGNRTHAARTLGLQRTYLVRLLRDLNIRVPVPQRPAECDNGE
jgi:DNA-binding NtrC family response regulator